jgi:hypothetical protein
MDIVKYLPLNTKSSIDILICDLKSGQIERKIKKEVEIECICHIRKIKLQLYFKEKFAEILESKIEQNDIGAKRPPLKNEKKFIRKSGNIAFTYNSLSEKEKQSEVADEYIINVPHERLKSLSINQIANEIKWDADLLITILNRKGVLKSGIEKLNYSEYELIKHVIELRFRKIQRKLSNPDTLRKLSNIVTIKKSKRLKKKRMKRSKPFQSESQPRNKSESVYDRMAKYGVGKLIYIRSK